MGTVNANGDAERVPIQTLLTGLTDRVALIQQAHDFHPVGVRALLPPYYTASEIMDKTLMPTAAALDATNLTVLDRTYQGKQVSVLRLLVLVIVVALSLLGVLVTVQLLPRARPSSPRCGHLGCTL